MSALSLPVADRPVRLLYTYAEAGACLMVSERQIQVMVAAGESSMWSAYSVGSVSSPVTTIPRRSHDAWRAAARRTRREDSARSQPARHVPAAIA